MSTTHIPEVALRQPCPHCHISGAGDGRCGFRTFHEAAATRIPRSPITPTLGLTTLVHQRRRK